MKAKRMYDQFGFYAKCFCKECEHFQPKKGEPPFCRIAAEQGVSDTWSGVYPACGLVVSEDFLSSPVIQTVLSPKENSNKEMILSETDCGNDKIPGQMSILDFLS